MHPSTDLPVIDRVTRSIDASIAVKQELRRHAPLLADVAVRLGDALTRGNKLMLFGNGGSAADAQHLAAEFVGRFLIERRPVPAMALTVNTSCLTAIGNDYGYELVFARQLEAFARPGDIAIGISTSGNSPSVIEGIRTARRLGVLTVGLTGRKGAGLKQAAELCVCVPSDETPRIQESHILIGHILCELAEEAIVKLGQPQAA
jgi:D-sedoheptulose 7-phosphate isomerase